MSIYSKFTILFFTLLLSFIFIAPNVFATVGPGAQWEDTFEVNLWRAGSTQVVFRSLNRSYVYSNVSYVANDTMYYFRQAEFIMYEMLTEFDQPVAVFAFKNINLYGDGSSTPQFYISGSWKTVYNITTASNISNSEVYMKTFTSNNYVRCTMVFIPIEQIVSYPADSSATYWELPYLPMWFRTQGGQNILYVLASQFSYQYLGNIDLENTNIVQYIDDIESSLTSIENKLDAVISILQDQQSSSAASSQEQQTVTEHDQIDVIQNNTLTDIGTVSNDIINNNNFNLHDTSMLSGAAYITAIANNIFTSMGTFSWLLVFCGFLAIIDYILGRVGIV